MLFIGLSWVIYQFSKSELSLMQHFTFLGLCWDTVDMSVSLPCDKPLPIQQLAHYCYRGYDLQSVVIISVTA